MREQDLRELLRSMSLEEKVGQMVQVTGAFLEEDAVITGPAADAGLTADDCRLAGSILGIAGAKRLREIQDRYMEAHPHHIPLLMMADVIHGYKTEFPIPLALGASFCPEAVERAMGMAAAEAASAGDLLPHDGPGAGSPLGAGVGVLRGIPLAGRPHGGGLHPGLPGGGQ